MLIGVCAVGKAHGVTTIASGLAMALAAHDHPALVVEADVNGGDLAYWQDLHPEQAGVLGFAAMVGSTGEAALSSIESHVWQQPNAPSCYVMPLSAGGVGIGAQLRALLDDGLEPLRGWPGAVVFDLGRYTDGICASLWRRMEVGIAVSGGSLAGLRRADAYKAQEPMSNDFATWLVLNGSPWTAEEIEAETALRFDAVLDWDRRCAELLRTGNWKAARRRHLGRQVSDLAGAIVADTELVRS